MMKPFLGMIVFILLCLSPSLPSFAQIYKWTDKNGNVVFSDTPPSSSEGKKVKVLPERREPVPQEEIKQGAVNRETAGPAASSSKEKRQYGDIEVLLYMTEWCPHSLRARAYLKSLGVRLIEYDVERDKSKNEEKARKSGKGSGVPVIDVEGIILKGFSEESVKNAVEKRRNM
jgi:glutaredoxin